jgi:hypothetical protein
MRTGSLTHPCPPHTHLSDIPPHAAIVSLCKHSPPSNGREAQRERTYPLCPLSIKWARCPIPNLPNYAPSSGRNAQRPTIVSLPSHRRSTQLVHAPCQCPLLPPSNRHDAQSNMTRLCRRPRRVPSQISTLPLLPYMKEPGDQELVLLRCVLALSGCWT